MPHQLSQKIAVITGACSGIGLATLELFVAEGAQVVAADVQNEAGVALEKKHPGQVKFVHCDVTQPPQIKAAIELAVSAFGGLDILFNNAGRGGSPAGIEDFDADSWDATHALLLRSVAAGTSYATPHLRARGGGSIINTSSISALQAGYAPIAYSVAKAGVLHYTRMAATELSRHKIRINAIVPGFIATSIFGGMLGMDLEQARQLGQMVAAKSGSANPIGRAGLPSDIAQAALFLASDASSFVTGTHLTVDGGLTMGPRHSWDPETPGPMQTALGLSRDQAMAMRAAAAQKLANTKPADKKQGA
jgi:NAD(P)-dependent dehydrogenase (short-subunit alcohol dehydrogenase family)